MNRIPINLDSKFLFLKFNAQFRVCDFFCYAYRVAICALNRVPSQRLKLTRHLLLSISSMHGSVSTPEEVLSLILIKRRYTNDVQRYIKERVH